MVSVNDRTVWRYARQSFTLTAGMTFALLCAMRILYIDSLLTPIVVGTIFALLVEISDILLWKRIATLSPDSLPIFFLGVSGGRLLTAVVVLSVYYFISDGDTMVVFFLVFMAYYLAILMHHTLFFAKERKNLQ